MPIYGPKAEIASRWGRKRSAFSVSGLEAEKGSKPKIGGMAADPVAWQMIPTVS